MAGKLRFIDLSTPISNGSFEPRPPEVTYVDHKTFGAQSAKNFGISPEELHDGIGGSVEYVTLSTHSVTHMDAPYHYGPAVGGKPARTIDRVPLEWCFGDGVRLDLRHKKRGEYITVEDIREALARIPHELKAGEIVLLMTGTDKQRGNPRYAYLHPGMSYEATAWLLDRGVRVIGIDAFGFDRPFDVQAEDYHRTKDKRHLMPCHHILGREREYIQVEQLANLDRIPVASGFRVACFPVNVERASGGWVRAVAIVEE